MGPDDRESADSLVRERLDRLAEELGRALGSDVLAFMGPLHPGADNLIRDTIESRKSDSDNLAVVVETNGGYIHVVERIVDTLRHHYPKEVWFLVPSHAMSAGTVLVMSGDRIYMDYYSTLGPIDPQIQRSDGSMVPALGYLAEYDRLVAKSRRGRLTDAEMAFFVGRFDPGELYLYKKERDLSVAMLENWLVRYKFKNWKKTETGRKKVTPKMRKARAVQIGRLLNNTERWHSHARGISMEVLVRDVNLQIRDFGADLVLARRIKGYFGLLMDYKRKRGNLAVSHVPGRFISV